MDGGNPKYIRGNASQRLGKPPRCSANLRSHFKPGLRD